MTTHRQAKANKMNAKRSTGPRSKAGKDTSRFNALKHGLTANSVILPTEDEGEYRGFAAEMYEALQPKDATQAFLAEDAIACAWRLRRAHRAEGQAMAFLLFAARARRAGSLASGYKRRVSLLSSIERTVVDDPAGLEAAETDAAERWEAAQAGELELGRSLATNTAAWERIARYQLSIERRFHAALRALREEQG